MKHPPHDANIALDIMATLSSVVFRVAGSFADSAPKTLFINEDIARLGYTREDFLSGVLAWPDIVHPGDRAAFARAAQDNLRQGTDRYALRYRVLTKQGGSLWVNGTCAMVRGPGGAVLHTDCVATADAPAAPGEESPGEAQRQQQALGDILQAIRQHSPDGAFRAVLERAARYLGIARATLYETLPSLTQSRAAFGWPQDGDGHAVDHSQNPALYGALARGDAYVEESAVALPVEQGAKTYGYVLFEDPGAKRQWPTGTMLFLRNVAGLLGTVLQRQETEEAVHRAASQDQLTGLSNRYPFDQSLKKALADARKSGDHGFVLFIDMDDFKVINEGYGHEYGDALLAEVARYLRESYADKCQLFRFSGDEFVLLVEHGNALHANAIMDDILNRARHPWTVLNHEFYCTVSLGVVRFPEPGMGVADVIKNADIAIHSAKSLGKNNCVVFSRGMDNDSLHRVELEHRMRECIENGFKGFEVYYQPIVSATGAITGAEALLRWFDKDGSMTAPAEFIPLAEYLGLIVPLGNFVLRSAAEECRRINRQNPEFSMSVNVSIRQFQQPDFLAQVEEALAATGVDPSNMLLEVTEGMLVEDIEQMQALLEHLRLMGLRIAMDDFGTGYSSLSNMRRLPLDVIKIDRAFVMDVTHDAYSQSFIQLITNLSHSMGRVVCVEGVETAAQYSYCAECRVDRIQGFYFYKPMPREQLHSAMAQNRVFTGRR